ncbi:MAG: hypothetical protein SOR11_04470 [Fusobacterium sp.]|uniref:hypothetical protein n=1 Tax=Fusobacterium sp. TaxID=68766 RepID=UPI002A74E7C7|nr:hypothetical protein [Fusobacterium sp.]MDY3059238.1 hypothetical protein [Fusobacterium sp.]
MERNSIKQLLMSSNYFILNKQLVKALGIETAFLLSALVEADDQLADEEGWFYQTSKTIEDITGLSNYKQSLGIEKLIDLGILEQINKGIPMKRYFKISYEKIQKLLFKKFENCTSKNLKTSSQKISKNKELNINNIDKKLRDKEIKKDDDNINNLDGIDQEVKEVKEDKKESSPKGSSSPFDIKTFKEIKDIVSKSTGVDRFRIDNIMTPSNFRDIDLRLLLQKIKESDFLQGKSDKKPNINHFSVRNMIERILADAYKTNKTDDVQVPKSPSRRVFIPEEVTGYGLDENGIFDFKVGE